MVATTRASPIIWLYVFSKKRSRVLRKNAVLKTPMIELFSSLIGTAIYIVCSRIVELCRMA